MNFGALGDIHGAFDSARRAIARHADVPFWLCVGDIADAAGRYEPLGAPVYWIHGNNDNFDAIASGDWPPDLHHIRNGTLQSLETGCTDPAFGDPGLVLHPGWLNVAGLGGTFAPTWYESAADDLPHPKKASAKATELADKRRHFVREEVEICMQLRGVDVFLTHEAPKPFRPFPGGRGPDAGKAQINEILRAMRPTLHLFGHHHRFSDQSVEGVRSIGLDLVTRSYALIRLPDFEVRILDS
jgi:Calcineurin-like phosphoesterase